MEKRQKKSLRITSVPATTELLGISLELQTMCLYHKKKKCSRSKIYQQNKATHNLLLFCGIFSWIANDVLVSQKKCSRNNIYKQNKAMHNYIWFHSSRNLCSLCDLQMKTWKISWYSEVTAAIEAKLLLRIRSSIDLQS